MCLAECRPILLELLLLLGRIAGVNTEHTGVIRTEAQLVGGEESKTEGEQEKLCVAWCPAAAVPAVTSLVALLRCLFRFCVGFSFSLAPAQRPIFGAHCSAGCTTRPSRWPVDAQASCT